MIETLARPEYDDPNVSREGFLPTPGGLTVMDALAEPVPPQPETPAKSATCRTTTILDDGFRQHDFTED